MNAAPTPRTDLPYLRRRIKPGTAPAATAPAAQATAPQAPAAPARPATPAAPSASGGLNLSGATPPAAPAPPAGADLSLGRTAPPVPARPAQTIPAPSTAGSRGLTLGGAAPAATLSPRMKRRLEQREQAKREDHEVDLLFAAPQIEDVYELNLSQRVLRLSPLQSAVGTLVISGSTATAWESVRRVTGGATVDGHSAGTPIKTSGNRDLVAYHGRDALITLRHVREMRRAIFINRSSSPMGVRLFSGESVALPPASDGAQIVLLVHRVGNVLELRAEPVPLDWQDVQIWQEFAFSMTHRAPDSAYGR